MVGRHSRYIKITKRLYHCRCIKLDELCLSEFDPPYNCQNTEVFVDRLEAYRTDHYLAIKNTANMQTQTTSRKCQ